MTRQFMDGVAAFMLKSRQDELMPLVVSLHLPLVSKMRSKSMAIVDGAYIAAAAAAAAGSGDEDTAPSGPGTLSPSASAREPLELIAKREVLTRLLNAEAEEAVLLPLQDRLFKLMRKSQSAPEVAELQRKLATAATRTQAFFQIPAEHQSSTDYMAAVSELQSLPKCVLPSEKLAALLRSVKAIYSTYSFERNAIAQEADEQATYVLGADEFLPVSCS